MSFLQLPTIFKTGISKTGDKNYDRKLVQSKQKNRFCKVRLAQLLCLEGIG